MSGTTSASIVGVKRWSSPAVSLDAPASGKSSPFRNSSAVLAHHDDELRLDDVQLARQQRPRLLLVLAGELEAVRAVDRHRVDVQPLERLEDRLARAAVERDALLHLRRLRPVLQQEHVGERVAGAEHRHARPAPACAISSPSSLISVMAFCRYFS